MGPQDSKIEHTETEPNEPGRGWEDGDETVQIKGDRRRGGRGGMVMPMVGSLGRVEAIGVHEAAHSDHSEQTGNQFWEDLAGF
jgi:hypothetical protein